MKTEICTVRLGVALHHHRSTLRQLRNFASVTTPNGLGHRRQRVLLKTETRGPRPIRRNRTLLSQLNSMNFSLY